MVTVITWLSTPKAGCGLDIKTKILKVETENTLRLHYLMSKWSIIRIINHQISSNFFGFYPLNHSKQKWECFTSEKSRPLHYSPLPNLKPGCCCTSCWSPWETRLMALQVPFSRSFTKRKTLFFPGEWSFQSVKDGVCFPRDASCEMIFKG